MIPGLAFVVAAITCLALSRSVVLAGERVAVRRVRSRALVLRRSPAADRARSTIVDRVRRAGASRRQDDVWPSWLDAAARSARSGASLRNALAEATNSFRRSPIGELLQPFEHALERGATLDAAIAELGGAGPSTTSGSLVVRALRLAARAGGPAASVLDAVASTLHERVALGREVRALSTQARASAVVMVVAPLVFALLAGGADRRVIAFFSSSAGVVCIVAGVVLDALGALWMTRIVRAAR